LFFNGLQAPRDSSQDSTPALPLLANLFHTRSCHGETQVVTRPAERTPWQSDQEAQVGKLTSGSSTARGYAAPTQPLRQLSRRSSISDPALSSARRQRRNGPSDPPRATENRSLDKRTRPQSNPQTLRSPHPSRNPTSSRCSHRRRIHTSGARLPIHLPQYRRSLAAKNRSRRRRHRPPTRNPTRPARAHRSGDRV
jgi:hypothetical protein